MGTVVGRPFWVLQHVFPFFTDLGRRFAGEVAQDAAEVRHGGDAEPVADPADGKVGGMKKRYGFFGKDTVLFLKRSAAESTARPYICMGVWALRTGGFAGILFT